MEDPLRHGCQNVQKLGGEAELVLGPAGILSSEWELGAVGQEANLEPLCEKWMSIEVMGAVGDLEQWRQVTRPGSH